MEAGRGSAARKLVEYDVLSRRVWILGQRLHHGATGSLVAAAACLALMSNPPSMTKVHVWPGSLRALVAAGGALMMAHDWKDRAIWFERGRGSQH
ncbi:MAG: hypothetical protein JO304_27420 [Solirubrobacterales bacterium]|nr:hypothetical protein [Solirubrobacterales bacterium]